MSSIATSGTDVPRFDFGNEAFDGPVEGALLRTMLRVYLFRQRGQRGRDLARAAFDDPGCGGRGQELVIHQPGRDNAGHVAFMQRE